MGSGRARVEVVSSVPGNWEGEKFGRVSEESLENDRGFKSGIRRLYLRQLGAGGNKLGK